jgi:hypothetical protein
MMTCQMTALQHADLTDQHPGCNIEAQRHVTDFRSHNPINHHLPLVLEQPFGT